MGFVRQQISYPTDFAVYRETYQLLEKWIDRGWLDLADKPHGCEGISSIQDLLPYLERHGASIVSEESDENFPK